MRRCNFQFTNLNDSSESFSQDEKNHANWSGRHYLERFDQPLNCKLNLAVRPNRAKGASSRFRFKYLAGKKEE